MRQLRVDSTADGAPAPSTPKPGQRQLGLLWGAVALVLLLSVPYAERLAYALPACLFKSFVGIACPSCGVTRTALALSRLDLAMALRVNPLAAVLLTALVGGGIVAASWVATGRTLREPRWDLNLVERLGIIAVIVANWIYLVETGA